MCSETKVEPAHSPTSNFLVLLSLRKCKLWACFQPVSHVSHSHLNTRPARLQHHGGIFSGAIRTEVCSAPQQLVKLLLPSLCPSPPGGDLSPRCLPSSAPPPSVPPGLCVICRWSLVLPVRFSWRPALSGVYSAERGFTFTVEGSAAVSCLSLLSKHLFYFSSIQG